MRLVRRLGKAARLGCVLMFAVLVSGMAFAQQPATPSDIDRLIAFFYRDPRPERLAGIFDSENARQHEYVKQTAADYIRGHRGAPATKALSVITGIK